MLRLPLLTLLGWLIAGVAMAETPAPFCDKAKLLEQIRIDASEAREAPPAAEGAHWQAVLHDSPLEMDGYKLWARIEPARKLAWVRRSGGIAGSVEWLGPYTVEPESLTGCPRAPNPTTPPLKSGKSLPATAPGAPAADR